jgi:hypothetical protein
MTNLKNISDNELFIRCKKYGKEALQARQRFAGLLPEVCKRRLYEKKKFASIYEFAAKLAGFSREQVDAVIRLERKFEDKPALHAALVDGQISANKLIRIASIATTENQGELFEAVQKLSKSAIDVYVRDYKTSGADDKIEHWNGLLQCENTPKTLPVQTSERAANIDFEIIAALSPELKIKMKALLDKGINVSELFTEFLEKREREIKQKKNKIAEDINQTSGQRIQFEPGCRSAVIGGEPFGLVSATAVHLQQKPVTRHIPARVKKIIKHEFGTKCAHANCKNTAEHLHHQKQFAIFRTHDPRFIKPLCKGHHELEHSKDQAYRYYKFASAG